MICATEILPILRAPKKYGGREVGLRRCEKNNFDGDVIFNLCHWPELDIYTSNSNSLLLDILMEKRLNLKPNDEDHVIRCPTARIHMHVSACDERKSLWNIR